MRIGQLEINWIPKHAWAEVWWTKFGGKFRIRDMADTHVRDCLAMIVNHALAGHAWAANRDGGLKYHRTMVHNAAIGRLVLNKLKSGNEVPVERCTITKAELDNLEPW